MDQWSNQEGELHPKDALDKERILALPIAKWIREVSAKAPKEGRSKFGYIRQLIRPAPLSVEQKQLLHPKLYPWLRDICGLKGIETVGDLVTIFKKGPELGEGAAQEPWKWFGLGAGGGPLASLYNARDILRAQGLLSE